MKRFALAVLLALAVAWPAQAQLVIAHRGASGERPEHTRAAYELALAQGADWLETDVVPTRDGALIVRHENELSVSTDVADRTEFAARRTTKTVDGAAVTGWFSEDFTLAELRTLRARERLPELRPANTAFDGSDPILTLPELLQLMKTQEAALGRPVTLLLELKHPAYFATAGHDVAALALADIAAAGFADGDPRIVIQSFERRVLCRLAETSTFRRAMLVQPLIGPADEPGVRYAEMITPAGLAALARCVGTVAPHTALVLQADGSARPLVADARAAGLDVFVWTLRRENSFLPAALRVGSEPGAAGDLATLVHQLDAAGVGGLITDNPAEVAAALGR